MSGIASDPNFKKSIKLNRIPNKIIPNFKIYFCVKSRPTVKLCLILNVLPNKIPSKIAINTVEIGLFLVSKICNASNSFIP